MNRNGPGGRRGPHWEGPVTGEGAAFHPLATRGRRGHWTAHPRPLSSCALAVGVACAVPSCRQQCAAEEGVGRVNWPRIWHWTWLVNAWRQPKHTNQFMPSILPLGSSTITTLFFFPRHFSNPGNLVRATRNRLEGEASVGREPRLLSSPLGGSSSQLCVQRWDTP